MFINRLNITANYTGSGVRKGVGGLVGDRRLVILSSHQVMLPLMFQQIYLM